MQIKLTYEELRLIHKILLLFSMMNRLYTTPTVRSLNNKITTALQESIKND